MMFVRLFIVLLLGLPNPALASPEKLLVFAAASMRDALEAVAEMYEVDCRCKIVFSFAGSSILARQIDAGAPVSVYISANTDWINWLDERGLLKGSTVTIAGNALVIAVKKNADTGSLQQSGQILNSGRFAMGDPRGVPAGIYAKAALVALGVWEDVKSNAVFFENVRLALSAVARGSLKSGIVYQSDLRIEPRVVAHYRFDTASHKPIGYTAAQPRSAGPEAKAFVEFLTMPTAQAVMLNHGFLPPPGETSQ